MDERHHGDGAVTDKVSMAQKKADMRAITEQPPPMMMGRPGPTGPLEIVEAVRSMRDMTKDEISMTYELLKLWVDRK